MIDPKNKTLYLKNLYFSSFSFNLRSYNRFIAYLIYLIYSSLILKNTKISFKYTIIKIFNSLYRASLIST